MKLRDIIFIIFAAIMLYLLIKEFIPDHVKKYWAYIRQSKKDHKAGWYNRKWVWTFRPTSKDKRG